MIRYEINSKVQYNYKLAENFTCCKSEHFSIH